MTKTFKKLREDTLDEQYFSHVGKDVSQKLSYDNWLKKIKGIEKGAHGVKGDQHTKLSKQWKSYRGQDKLAASYEEVDLNEGYEKKVLGLLKDWGINAEFKYGTLYVVGDAGVVKAKQILDRDSGIHATPTIKKWSQQNEDLNEGRMKELHTLIQQGKSAEEIAKIMKLDVKTVKALMPKEEVKEGIKSQSHYDKEQEKIARDTVKNPSKDLLSGPTSAEAEKVLRDKFGYTDAEIKKLKEEVNEVSPPGWGGSVKAMKKHADIDNPYALAWHMKNKGDKPHYKDKDGTPVKKDKYKDEQMEQVKEQSYKDKFNAALKHFSVNSIDDLKSDEEKKKFFNYVDSKHKADNEEVKHKEDATHGYDSSGQSLAPVAASHKKGQKKEDHDCAKVHPDKSHKEWEMKKENTELDESSLTSTQIQNIKKLWNDPEKKTEKDVTQAVKDIVKRWDTDTRYAVAKAGIKHLSKLAAATESRDRYFDVKPGSIEDSINKMKELEETSVTINKKEIDDLVKQYIAKGGVVTKLPPALAPDETPPKEWDLVKGKSIPGSGQGQVAYKVKKVGSGYKILKAQLREFIRIYNEHFLTNYAAEEFIVEEK